jgi:hypothetical protein
MIECFAENFTNGNKEKAQKILTNENTEIRRKDAIWLAFFSGTLLTTSIGMLAVIFLPHTDKEQYNYLDWDEVILSLPVFRFFLMVILLVLLVAFDVYILRKFRINYLFIFELDPHYKITHIQFFRVR